MSGRASSCLVAALMAILIVSLSPDNAASRILYFAGHRWQVRPTGDGGPPGSRSNHWLDDPSSEWVDGGGQLHLKLRSIGDAWYCAEVHCDEIATYGPQRFYVISRLDQLDLNVVAAFFLYANDSHELDIEFSRWRIPLNPFDGKYTVQPGGIGQWFPFGFGLSGDYTTQEIDWEPASVRFRSWGGHYAQPPSGTIADWTYTGGGIWSVPVPRTTAYDRGSGVMG